MQPRKIGDNVTVNDGNGLFDGFGLLDTLIEDCNELPKDLINGQNIRFCLRISQMAQKLANLKKGFSSEIESLKEQIRDYAEKGGDAGV